MGDVFGLNHHDVLSGTTTDYWEGLKAVVEGQRLLFPESVGYTAVDALMLGGMSIVASGVEATPVQP